MAGDALRRDIEQLAATAGATAVAVALHDFEHRTGWFLEADRWFHAASTIKVAVLFGVHAAIEEGRVEPHSRVHVRNRFLSAADGTPFRVDPGRDANPDVYQARGRTMQIRELAHHMIATSSNLATNLLVDLVGVEYIAAALSAHGIAGIEIRRGVEDESAWAQGINNRVTAAGLAHLLRLIAAGSAISELASKEMCTILLEQRFRSGIPAGLPDGAQVAHKTGEISTAAHDAGIVYLPDREPAVLVVLTEWQDGGAGRQKLVASVTQAIHEALLAPPATPDPSGTA